jgi:serine protease Do
MNYANLFVRLSVLAALWLGNPGADSGDVLTSFRFAATALAAAARAAGPATVLPDFASIVEANKRSVVNITAIAPSDPSEGPPPPGSPSDPFFEFFRRFQIPQPQVPRRSQASGFIVGADGTILTNAHAVGAASDVTVKLADRREFRAKVIGVDELTDIAVLKIDAKGLPAVKLGDPKSVRVGEWVLAIGSPFGLENTVTAGIVSATSRSLPDGIYVPFIQTDAAVNPGNSGGPLLNISGEVIGINSQIYSVTGGYQGLSFAIPIDVAAKVKDELILRGSVQRGRIGVGVQELTQPLARSFGLDKPGGALVTSAEKNGPAAKAGIQPGDVILALNGVRIERASELPLLVAQIKPGTRVTLEVWRKGARREVPLIVDELRVERLAQPAPPRAQGEARLGISVRSLTAEESRAVGVAGGVLVERSSGPAAAAGIQEGDLIIAVNGAPARNVSELANLLDKSGKVVALLIQRDGETLFVPVELP